MTAITITGENVILEAAEFDGLVASVQRDEARIADLEAALQLIGNELDLHADQGPAGEAFRALLVPTLEPHLRGPIIQAHADTNGVPPAETSDELCPHGFVLADNTCGPCSEGRPNRTTSNREVKP